MLKQQIYLYDKIRQDLFEDKVTHSSTERVPSITTMFLLQIQASIIHLLTQLPSKSKLATHTTTLQKPSSFSLLEQKRQDIISSIQFVSFQCIHWFLLILLFILDNVARFLNVDHEMAEITNKSYQQQKIDFGESEPSSPTKPTLVQPSSPVHSPTPNFIRKPPTADSRGVRIRSLSNNMVDQKKPMSPQKLRRITAQREITVQNGVLPIQQKKSTKKPHSISSSGSSSTTKETDRPRMQKTMSLTTAQQYHEVKLNHKSRWN